MFVELIKFLLFWVISDLTNSFSICVGDADQDQAIIDWKL